METPIATDVQQSKQLAAAGLDPKTADMRYEWWNEFSSGKGRWSFDGLHIGFNDSKDCQNYRVIPAWSLSRLWDLCHQSNEYGGWDFDTADIASRDVMESLVRGILHQIELGWFDKQLLKI